MVYNLAVFCRVKALRVFSCEGKLCVQNGKRMDARVKWYLYLLYKCGHGGSYGAEPAESPLLFARCNPNMALQGTDPVPAQAFCLIQGIIRPDKRSFRIFIGLRYFGNSQADSYRYYFCLVAKTRSYDAEAYLLCNFLCVHDIASMKNGNQLFSSIAGKKIGFPQRCLMSSPVLSSIYRRLYVHTCR